MVFHLTLITLEPLFLVVALRQDICFDVLPAKENIVSNITRSKLILVAPGEDETATPSTQQEFLDKIEGEEEV
jgi:hypothetical protein